MRADPGARGALGQPSQTTIGGQYYGHEKEQATRATLGGGQIVVGGKTLTEHSVAELGLQNLNRDLALAQEITLDKDIGGLNASITVDNRWITKQGRDSILEDFEKLPDHLKLAGTGLVTDVLRLGIVATGVATADVDGAARAIKSTGRAYGMSYQEDASPAAKTRAIQTGEYQDNFGIQDTTNTLDMTLNGGSGNRALLGDGLTNKDGQAVAATANMDAGVFFVDRQQLGSLVNNVVHEGLHLSGSGHAMAWFGGLAAQTAFDLGVWANQDYVAQFAPAPTYNFGLMGQAAQQSLLNQNMALFDAMKARGDAFEDRQLHANETAAINRLANAYAAERFGVSDTKLSQAQIDAAKVLLTRTAEKLVDSNMDRNRPYDQQSLDFLLNTGLIGRPIAGTDQMMFMTTEEQRNDYRLNMPLDHPVIVAEKNALISYNLAVARGDIIPGQISDGINPLVPQVDNREWGSGNHLVNISRIFGNELYIAQQYPCYVVQCSGNNYVKNDTTRRYLDAQSAEVMGDLLNVASLSTGISAIAYGALGRSAPVLLNWADNITNAFQVINSGARDGVSGAGGAVATWLFGVGSAAAAKNAEMPPIVAPVLELGVQQSMPKAIDEVKKRNEIKN